MTSSEQTALAARIATLRQFVDAPADTSEGLKAVARLLLGFSTTAVRSETETAEIARSYAHAIDDLPVWAINAARRAWARGEVEPARSVGKVDTNFPPPPAMVRALALAALAGPRGELHRLQRLRQAEPERHIPDEVRRSNLARLGALLGPKETAA